MKRLDRPTEADWQRVFLLRCNGRRGEPLSGEELALCRRALADDGERYRGMSVRVEGAARSDVWRGGGR